MLADIHVVATYMLTKISVERGNLCVGRALLVTKDIVIRYTGISFVGKFLEHSAMDL